MTPVFLKKIRSFLKDYVKNTLLLVFRFFLFPVVWLVNYFLYKSGRIFVYRLFGSAIGDALVLSGFLEYLYSKSGVKIYLFVKNSKCIFEANPRLSFLFEYDSEGKVKRAFVKNMLHIFHGRSIVEYVEGKSCPPRIFFSEKEIFNLESKFSDLPKNFVVIKPVGKVSFTTKKEWGIENFQKVVNQIDNVVFVQLGTFDDGLLNGVVDFRGKTSLREMFWIISKSKAVVSIEGLFNHVAAAFNVPSVVVCSGMYPLDFFK